jgi:hypothetical protein
MAPQHDHSLTDAVLGKCAWLRTDLFEPSQSWSSLGKRSRIIEIPVAESSSANTINMEIEFQFIRDERSSSSGREKVNIGSPTKFLRPQIPANVWFGFSAEVLRAVEATENHRRHLFCSPLLRTSNMSRATGRSVELLPVGVRTKQVINLHEPHGSPQPNRRMHLRICLASAPSQTPAANTG